MRYQVIDQLTSEILHSTADVTASNKVLAKYVKKGIKVLVLVELPNGRKKTIEQMAA